MRQHWNLEGVHKDWDLSTSSCMGRESTSTSPQLAGGLLRFCSSPARQAKTAVAKKAADGAAQVPTRGRAISTLDIGLQVLLSTRT